MEKYIEVKFEMSSKDGKRVWINPVATGVEKTLDEKYAKELNAQFENTGVLLATEGEWGLYQTIEKGTSEVNLLANSVSGGASGPALEQTNQIPEIPQIPVIPPPPVDETGNTATTETSEGKVVDMPGLPGPGEQLNPGEGIPPAIQNPAAEQSGDNNQNG